MIPKCFVVNMPSAEERRTAMQETLGKLGLEFEFFTATDGRKLSEAEQAQCAISSEVILPLRGGRKLMVKNALAPAEVGCAFSHLRLYQQIVDSGLERAVIMEDDFIPHPDSLVALESLDKITEPWDMVTFSSHLGIKNLPLSRKYYFGGDKAHYFQRLGMHNPLLDAIHNQRRVVVCAAFYVVTRAACQRLLALGYPVRLAADYLTGLICYNELRVFRAFPLNHYIKMRDVPSSIGDVSLREHDLVRM